MKADLYIGDNPPKSIELLTAPLRGQLIIWDGSEYIIHQVAHDADKRKLRVEVAQACDRMAPPVAEQTSEATPDLTPEMLDVARDILGIELDTDLETE